MSDFAVSRRAMVNCQLRPSEVTDAALLDVMDRIPRELFVPPALASLAYADRTHEITSDHLSVPETGERNTGASAASSHCLLAPVVLARLIQALAIAPGARVLDVAGGTGYGAAVLAALGAQVTLLDTSFWTAQAASTFAKIGLNSVQTANAALDRGWAESAPYDAILIEGAIEKEPEALLRQLKPNGRLATIKAVGGVSKAFLYRSVEELSEGVALFDAAAPVLPDFRKTPEFVF